MKNIVIFGGTTEGRILSECLSKSGIRHTVCVASDFGEEVLPLDELVSIHNGRLDEEEMSEFFTQNSTDIIVDATHPYAVVVSQNIKNAARNKNIEYVRVLREEEQACIQSELIKYYESFEEVYERLSNEDGNILFTTGSKNLASISDSYKSSLFERSYFRVLPSTESLKICEDAGVDLRRVLAMYGPFSEDMNIAQIKEYNISHLITKQSGVTGGFPDKINAALKCKIHIHVIGRPLETEGVTLLEATKILGCEPTKISLQGSDNTDCNIIKEISVIGIGMGNPNTLTLEAKCAIDNADILLGARRMLLPYEGKKEIKSIYLPDEVFSFATENDFKKIAVLVSGDSGFFSGAGGIINRFNKSDDFSVKVICGISSVSYFAAKLGVSYSDAELLSIHGRSDDVSYLDMIADKIRYNGKSFVLLSGKTDFNLLKDKLVKSDEKSDYKVWLGYNLSYDDEEVFEIGSSKSMDLLEKIADKSLLIAYIVNQNKENRPLGIELRDSEFIRDKVPMTKEQIRHICVSKLNLRENSVVYDIGAGTGSVSIEIAKQHASLHVYAIEQKEEAVKLIEQNINKFDVSNVHVVMAKAPDKLDLLPLPTHAFIGGSSGNLETIVEKLIELNPDIRIVISAVTIETVSIISALIKKYCGELIMVQVSSARQAGAYNLMEAANPVYIGMIN